MGLFSKKRKKRDRQLQDALMQRLDGRELLYVVRRGRGADGTQNETVLGKGGRFICAGGHVSVIAGENEVFRNESPKTVSCGELMALNGVLIQGHNDITGQADILVAYYAK